MRWPNFAIGVGQIWFARQRPERSITVEGQHADGRWIVRNIVKEGDRHHAYARFITEKALRNAYNPRHPEKRAPRESQTA
jgi:hypothetical protein